MFECLDVLKPIQQVICYAFGNFVVFVLYLFSESGESVEVCPRSIYVARKGYTFLSVGM